MRQSQLAEKMFKTLLTEAGVPDTSIEYTREFLLTTVEKIRPGRLKNVSERILQDEGRRINWQALPVSKILDLAYGFDAVCAPAGKGSKERFGFDVTLNPIQLQEKKSKFKEFQALWRAIGITNVGVILLIPPESGEWGLGISNMSRLTDELIYDVLAPMQELTEAVHSFTLSL